MPERDRDLPVPLLLEILCFYLDRAGEQWKPERFHQMTFGFKREDKIKTALEEAGSSLENIVKVVVYFKDMKDYERVRETEFEYYKEHAPALAHDPPASTVCQVVSLSKENMLVEFDIIALRG